MCAQIRAVAFDLDGLMLNTEDIFELAGRELMRRRGKTMTDECRHAMLGRRPHEAFEILKSLMNIDDPIPLLQEETREIFTALIDDHLAPMPGLFELLSFIDQHALPMAVATSSPGNYMRNMLDRYDLLERFQHYVCAEDVRQGKPDPEVYLITADLLGVDPSNMLVFEDSEAGTRAASAAGAVTVSVPNRHTASQDFTTASHLADSLAAPLIRKLITG